MKDLLGIFANISSTLTAVVATGFYLHYACDKRKKRTKLEVYLKNAASANPEQHTYTTLHLMAQLGLTESEILN
jgi:hypothetical protein